MSLHWSANQYQSAFRPKRLQNHEVPMQHRPMPNSLNGCTLVVGNDRGHLLPGVSRSKNNPWGNFVGTWDLPHKISGNRNTVTTARNTYSQDKMKNETHESNLVLSGRKKNEMRLSSKEGNPTADSRSGAKPPTPKEASQHDSKDAAPVSPKDVPKLATPSPRKSPTPVCTPTKQATPNPTSRPASGMTGVW